MSVLHRLRCVLGVVAATVCLSVQAGVVDPSMPVAGFSQQSLAEQWWQWVLGRAAATDPIADSTGAFAGVNNDGPVFFVAGSYFTALGDAPVTRSFNVPHGKPIFFPLVNWVDIEGNSLPYCYADASFACASYWLSQYISTPSALAATLDGVDLLTFPSFFQRSTSLFNVDVPADGMWGIPESTGYVGVTAGYWLAFDGLSKGEHVLSFGATFPDAQVSVVANLNVVPEPGTLLLLAPLLACVAVGRRRAI